ncbi:transducer, TlpC [Cereibacter azotoformans]|uniref:Methyl-accepting chemotaxis protein n=1 Tax=Cereibacter azotoformans TaxID=43057 RepID=A0A2T5KEK4_9RHOB|nr:transducer, TlpC [Cereibacter azotoformans]AXQ92543.1 transducer, TlpC [Cereibacter sphaeroides]MBO4169879.1 transducer, TlpC [Cereibacter azotoformans]PTR20859.1 methyl-accepting chemotaxis protein [Cereibacter azotoformans]UIJ30818.1 transducer, TlpC [Cereibacter azotoformans]
MKYEASLRENARTAQPAHPLDFVLLSTEQTFLRAGETLSMAVGQLNGLRADFVRLDAALGPARNAQFAALTADTGAQITALAQEFSRSEEASRALRSAVSAMRSEVTDLMATIRAISIVKLQARIIGNMLTSSRQRVEAFTGGLTRMAAEAADLVAEVDEAMNEIAAATDAMDGEAAHLSQTLRELVLPNLAAIGASAAEVQSDQQRIADGNLALARRMEGIFTGVSHLILALQAGDSARQRFEHIRDLTSDSLEQAEGQPALQALLLEIGVGQTDATVRGLTGDLDDATRNFLDVQGNADAAIAVARGLYLGEAQRGGGALHAMVGRAEAVEVGLARCTEHLRLLAGHAARVAAHLEKIRHHEERMRRIEDLVRLFGLNAVIVCAKLGQEGRALQEISRQLRDLTQVSAAVFTRLHGRLELTQERASAIGTEAVSGLEQEMQRVAHGARAIREILREANEAHDETGHAFGKAGRILTASLETAAGLMSGYRRNLTSLQVFREQMVRRRMMLQGSAITLEPGSAAGTLLASVRGRYTVPDERRIHDAIVAAATCAGGSGAQAEAPADPVADPAPVEAQPLAEAPEGSEVELDDIFF